MSQIVLGKEPVVLRGQRYDADRQKTYSVLNTRNGLILETIVVEAPIELAQKIVAALKDDPTVAELVICEEAEWADLAVATTIVQPICMARAPGF